jgi:hypothetical protein
MKEKNLLKTTYNTGQKARCVFVALRRCTTAGVLGANKKKAKGTDL